MKRTDLISKIGKAAADAGTTFEKVREGGSHTIYRYGSQNVVIPRHKEINENTARGILRTLGLR
ncbi:type II toxin-antitoxin system HicA family toxin [Micromonospora sp. NPDC007230]|uniref:type II toxin-antitoxin system HicA family toxin n=1 Tax=Micromonospora sp. NPDC007230 TaxID=3364237 RepID=UPI0036C4F01B